MTECSICIETYSPNNIFACNACKYMNCIDCHKTYLLTSTQDPHCINCRAAIPYELFLNKFSSKWIFDKYKKHKYQILWEREQSLFPETVSHISLKKKESILLIKKRELKKQIDEITNAIYLLNHKEKAKTIAFKYTYACPIENCKGFLNEDYNCEICDSHVCSKCYIRVEAEYIDAHECDPELVETFAAIKKEAKPCPTCGEFISKISGCDQMFCVKCGTAFSWKTGLVEKGIIHNPHAHAFFENNVVAQQNYLNNQNQNNDGCRPPIPPVTYFNVTYFVVAADYQLFIEMYRRISEFIQYDRTRMNRYIQANHVQNLDLRIKYINNEITEKSFKQTLHLRDKKEYYKKNIFQTFIYAYEIAEFILWAMADIIGDTFQTISLEKKKEQIHINLNMLKQLIIDTNNNFNVITCNFDYTSKYKINDDFSHYYISV